MTTKFQEHINSLSSYTPKQLRTLRNNLNNRLTAFKEKGEEGARPLSPSHRLYGLEAHECEDLLRQVKKALLELD